jgi:hypothetical protein
MASGLRFIGGTSSGGAGGASASVAAGFGNGSTDATAAIQAAVDSLGTKGGDVFIPAGVYMVSTSIVVPGGVMLRGSAMEYSGFATPDNLSRGSVIAAAPGFTPATNASAEAAGVIHHFGSAFPPSVDPASATPDRTGGGCMFVNVDGRGIANCFSTEGRRTNFIGCQAIQPLKHCFLLSGQNCYLLRCVGACENAANSDGVYAENWDHKIHDCEFRDFVVAGVNGRSGHTGLEIQGCHMWGDGPCVSLTSSAGNDGQVRITNNTFDDVGDNNAIELWMSGSGNNYRSIIIASNVFYHNSTWASDGAWSCFYVDAASGTVVRASFIGNVVSNPANSTTTQNWKSMVEKSASAGTVSVAMTGNYGEHCNALFSGSGFRPAVMMSNITVGGGVGFRSENGGKLTANGTGAATAFNIPHGMNQTPDHAIVTPGHANARGDFSIALDATNIVVTYATAPVSGTSNVVLHWKAFV